MLCCVEDKDAMEIVHRWKDFDKSLSVSAADSAFGSDFESVLPRALDLSFLFIMHALSAMLLNDQHLDSW